MKRDVLYHNYRKRTISKGVSPIGKRRFNGIIDTLIEIKGDYKITESEILSHKITNPPKGTKIK